MIPKLSEKGKRFIKNFEGLRLEAYKCPAGVWTIGYGHTHGVKPGQKITQAQADRFFDEDVEYFVFAVHNLLAGMTLPPDQRQFDALVSLAYNIGLGAFSKSTLLRMVRAKAPVNDVAVQFRRWVYGGGKKLQGLVHRRNQEALVYMAGGDS